MLNDNLPGKCKVGSTYRKVQERCSELNKDNNYKQLDENGRLIKWECSEDWFV